MQPMLLHSRWLQVPSPPEPLMWPRAGTWPGFNYGPPQRATSSSPDASDVRGRKDVGAHACSALGHLCPVLTETRPPCSGTPGRLTPQPLSPRHKHLSDL